MTLVSNRSTRTLLMVAFGYITFFGAVLFSVSSNASVRDNGTFVPSACGEAVQAENQPVVSTVCIGQIAGELSKSAMGAFEFRDEKGAPAVYRVTEVSNLLIKLMSGATRTQVFMVGPTGDKIAVKINRMADGSFKNASGTIGDAQFTVPDFSPVMTIQSASI
ncbi:hypothetical protein BH10BDE1_BH10BDE1_23560 [soil metagenome]